MSRCSSGKVRHSAYKTVLLGDPGSVPCITDACSSNHRGSSAPHWTPPAPDMHMVHRHTHAGKSPMHMKIKLILKTCRCKCAPFCSDLPERIMKNRQDLHSGTKCARDNQSAGAAITPAQDFEPSLSTAAPRRRKKPY